MIRTVLALLLLPTVAAAGADETVDPRVPTPAAFLGYEPGDDFTPPHRVAAYLDALQAATRRVVVRDYGATPEGRRLAVAFVASEARAAELDALGARWRRLADPRGLAADETGRLLHETPLLVFLAHGIHGDEAASGEAALRTLYRLAAGRDAETGRWLREVVVAIDPDLNPDGRDRFVVAARARRGRAPDPDPAALEHRQPWPGGRFNHALFDLNRDWFLLSQPETRARVRLLRDFPPQVFADLHEMSAESPYFFAPPAEPVNERIPPEVREGWRHFGRAIGAAFDRAGARFFVAERYDAFYPGYGVTWPSLRGAVGMTFEQGGGGKGLAWRRENGTVLTLRERLENHHRAALATVARAAEGRADLLRAFVTARRRPLDEATAADAPRELLLAPGSDPAPARRLATLLDAQGIEVERARGPLLARRAADADGRVEELRKLPEGTLIVPLAQPEAALARAILEARSGLAPAVLEEERRRAAAGRPTTFYDVTAWSLPLCFGLEVYQTPVPAEGPRASAAEPEPAAAPPAAPDPAAAAHAIRADAPGALRAAVGLLSAGARLLVLGTRQKLDGQELPPGSLVLPAGGGVPVERLAAVARASGAPLVPLRRLFPDEGPGLGSASVTEVRLPLVAVLAERPTSATSVGGLRFALEEAGLAPTLVPVDAVGGARLRDWDALVVPDADPGALRATLGDGGVAALRAWVADGGTLVAVKGGAVFCGQEGVDLAATKLRRKFPRKETTPDGKTVEVEREEPPVRVPGALLRTVVGDPTHFLAWGLGAEVTVQVTTDFVFTGGSGRGVVLAFAAADRLVRSGALPEEARPRLAGSPYLVEESRGRGRVVLFLDDPGFRAFFPPLERALLAAVLFGRR